MRNQIKDLTRKKRFTICMYNGFSLMFTRAELKVSSPGWYDTVSSTWTGIDSCSTVYTLAAGIGDNKT